MKLYRMFIPSNKSCLPEIQVRQYRERPMAASYPWPVSAEDLPFHNGQKVAAFWPMGEYKAGAWDHYYAYLRALKAAGHSLTDKKTRRDELADIPADGAL